MVPCRQCSWIVADKPHLLATKDIFRVTQLVRCGYYRNDRNDDLLARLRDLLQYPSDLHSLDGRCQRARRADVVGVGRAFVDLAVSDLAGTSTMSDNVG